MPRSLGSLCRDVLIALALNQPEPERTEWLTILRNDGTISDGEFARLTARAA